MDSSDSIIHTLFSRAISQDVETVKKAEYEIEEYLGIVGPEEFAEQIARYLVLPFDSSDKQLLHTKLMAAIYIKNLVGRMPVMYIRQNILEMMDLTAQNRLIEKQMEGALLRMMEEGEFNMENFLEVLNKISRGRRITAYVYFVYLFIKTTRNERRLYDYVPTLISLLLDWENMDVRDRKRVLKALVLLFEGDSKSFEFSARPVMFRQLLNYFIRVVENYRNEAVAKETKWTLRFLDLFILYAGQRQIIDMEVAHEFIYTCFLGIFPITSPFPKGAELGFIKIINSAAIASITWIILRNHLEDVVNFLVNQLVPREREQEQYVQNLDMFIALEIGLDDDNLSEFSLRLPRIASFRTLKFLYQYRGQHLRSLLLPRVSLAAGDVLTSLDLILIFGSGLSNNEILRVKPEYMMALQSYSNVVEDRMVDELVRQRLLQVGNIFYKKFPAFEDEVDTFIRFCAVCIEKGGALSKVFALIVLSDLIESVPAFREKLTDAVPGLIETVLSLLSGPEVDASFVDIIGVFLSAYSSSKDPSVPAKLIEDLVSLFQSRVDLNDDTHYHQNVHLGNALLENVYTLLGILSDEKKWNNGDLFSLQASLAPFVMDCLWTEEFFDNALMVLSYLVYYSSAVDSVFYTVLDPITCSYSEFDRIDMSGVTMVLDNLISIGGESFLNHGSNYRMIKEIILNFSVRSDSSEDAAEGLKIGEVLIQKFSKQDDIVFMLEVALGLWNQGTIEGEAVAMVFVVISDCMLIDHKITFEILSGLGEKDLKGLIRDWVFSIRQGVFKTQYQRKMSVMGLMEVVKSLPGSGWEIQRIVMIVSAFGLLLEWMEHSRMKKGPEAVKPRPREVASTRWIGDDADIVSAYESVAGNVPRDQASYDGSGDEEDEYVVFSSLMDSYDPVERFKESVFHIFERYPSIKDEVRKYLNDSQRRGWTHFFGM